MHEVLPLLKRCSKPVHNLRFRESTLSRKIKKLHLRTERTSFQTAIPANDLDELAGWFADEQFDASDPPPKPNKPQRR